MFFSNPTRQHTHTHTHSEASSWALNCLPNRKWCNRSLVDWVAVRMNGINCDLFFCLFIFFFPNWFEFNQYYHIALTLAPSRRKLILPRADGQPRVGSPAPTRQSENRLPAEEALLWKQQKKEIQWWFYTDWKFLRDYVQLCHTNAFYYGDVYLLPMPKRSQEPGSTLRCLLVRWEAMRAARDPTDWLFSC